MLWELPPNGSSPYHLTWKYTWRLSRRLLLSSSVSSYRRWHSRLELTATLRPEVHILAQFVLSLASLVLPPLLTETRNKEPQHFVPENKIPTFEWYTCHSNVTTNPLGVDKNPYETRFVLIQTLALEHVFPNDQYFEKHILSY